MDLLEYQAKQLFAQVDIPVLPSQPLLNASDLKNLQIPYPVVLKSQVLASERMKYGGVRFVDNTIDAIAVAQSLFNLPIKQEYPQVVLAEAHYDAQDELFLGIMIDYALKKPVLLGSAYGGDDVEFLLDNVQRCVIEEEFSPFYARSLARKIGLTGNSLLSVTDIVEKMYHLLITYDLDLIEINPLGMNQNGELMALDGKIRVNDFALHRHQQLLTFFSPELDNNVQNQTEDLSQLDFLPYESVQEFELQPDSNMMLITDNLDQTIFMIKNLQQNNNYFNRCQLLSLKNKEFWQKNINTFIARLKQLNKIELILVNHGSKDEFVDILLAKITADYQEEKNNINLGSEERSERPTGFRTKKKNKQKQIKSTPNRRKINWLVRNMSPDYQLDRFDDLPIHFVTSLESIEQVINELN